MKPCKGNYRVNNFQGCGTNDGYNRKFGLCPKCLYKWTQESSLGKEWFNKQTAFKQAKNNRKKSVEKTKQTRQMKIDLMSNTEYWSKELQPKINLIARLIDHGHPCIATGNFGKMAGGHYVSVGSNRTLSLNLHNIFIQSFASNSFKGGDTLKYQIGLKNTFGEDYFNFIESLPQCPSLNITKIEMIEYRETAMEIIKDLKNDDKSIRTPNERIELRNKVNQELGIYEKQFSFYDNINS